MRFKSALIVTAVVAAFVLAGCGLVPGIPGGSSAQSAGQLWSDVPAMPGSNKVNLDMPPLVNLMIQGFIQAANQDNNTKLNSLNFVAYNTSASAQEVEQFYTVDKMKAQGWTGTDTPGCAAGTEQAGIGGGFCVFGKEAGTQQTVLFIVITPDENTRQTQLFYVRAEMTGASQ
jgi:hypothetical protein